MFKFLKPGIEFNNFIKAMNGLNAMIQTLIPKLKTSNNFSELTEEVLIMAYISRKGILDRLEQYNWPIDLKITVPTIEKSKITIAYSLQQTVGKILLIANELNISDEVQDIIDKGKSYYEIEKMIPSHLKSEI